MSIHISDCVTLLVDGKEIKGITAIEPEDENLSVDIKWPKDGLSSKEAIEVTIELKPTFDTLEFFTAMVEKSIENEIRELNKWFDNALFHFELTRQEIAYKDLSVIADMHTDRASIHIATNSGFSLSSIDISLLTAQRLNLSNNHDFRGQ